VTGIGFLGSGAFIKQKTTGKIHGFTNGACIWIFAVFGIAIGLGGKLCFVFDRFHFISLVKKKKKQT